MDQKYSYESFNSSTEVIDISGYSKLRKVYESGYDEIIEIEGFKTDLSDIFNKLINHEKVEEIVIPLDQNNDFYVIHMNIDVKNNKVTYYSIEGYILTK